MMYHGTSQQYAEAIKKEGLDPDSYLTSEFEFAAGYALRQKGNATILCFEDIEIEPPDEPAYWDDVEFVSKARAWPVQSLRPIFDAENLPDDYYELNDDITDRKYPHLFAKESWE